MRGGKSKQLLDNNNFPCQYDTLNRTTTKNINSARNNSEANNSESNNTESNNSQKNNPETTNVINNVKYAVTNESMTIEEPQIFEHDGDLVMSDLEQKKTGSDDHLNPEGDNYLDGDYTPDNDSALQQLVSYVYLNKTKNQVPHKPKTIKLKQLQNSNMKNALPTATEKVSKTTVYRAVTRTSKPGIDAAKCRRPVKNMARNSDTKYTLYSPSIKPIDISKLRIQHERSEDQAFGDSSLKTNRAKADDNYTDNSKFKSLESVYLKGRYFI